VATVYALDTRRNLKVRYGGLVHYAMTEQLVVSSAGRSTSQVLPYGALCGAYFGTTDETPAYLENAKTVMVTCVACLGDRRRR